MRGGLAALVILAIGPACGCAARTPLQGPAPPVDPAVSERTVGDGVYTEDQSRRGETIYFAKCVLCHRPELTGSQIVPPLIGEPFLARWNRRTAGDLFEWMRTSMPPVVTSRLSNPEYADVLAYILSRNEFPAGEAELAPDFAALAAIRMAPSESGNGEPRSD